MIVPKLDDSPGGKAVRHFRELSMSLVPHDHLYAFFVVSPGDDDKERFKAVSNMSEIQMREMLLVITKQTR